MSTSPWLFSIIQPLIEGRDANGTQFYDKYTDAPLKIKPGQWNSVTFTVERPNAENPGGKVRLYVMVFYRVPA